MPQPIQLQNRAISHNHFSKFRLQFQSDNLVIYSVHSGNKERVNAADFDVIEVRQALFMNIHDTGSKDGGALSYSNNAGLFFLSSADFYNCQAVNHGGAIYIDCQSQNISLIKISYCLAEVAAAAMLRNSENASIIDQSTILCSPYGQENSPESSFVLRHHIDLYISQSNVTQCKSFSSSQLITANGLSDVFSFRYLMISHNKASVIISFYNNLDGDPNQLNNTELCNSVICSNDGAALSFSDEAMQIVQCYVFDNSQFVHGQSSGFRKILISGCTVDTAIPIDFISKDNIMVADPKPAVDTIPTPYISSYDSHNPDQTPTPAQITPSPSTQYAVPTSEPQSLPIPTRKPRQTNPPPPTADIALINNRNGNQKVFMYVLSLLIGGVIIVSFVLLIRSGHRKKKEWTPDSISLEVVNEHDLLF